MNDPGAKKDTAPRTDDRRAMGVALLLLFVVFLRELEERPLTIHEATHAAHALGPLENDLRGVDPGSSRARVAPLVRAWAMAVGASPRSLRLACILSTILAALLLGEVASVLGAGVRALVYVGFTLDPLLRIFREVFDPAMFAHLPLALILGGAAFARHGGIAWLLGAVAGGLMLPAFDGLTAAGAIGGLVTLLLREWRRPARALVVLAGVLAPLVALRLAGVNGTPWAAPDWDTARSLTVPVALLAALSVGGLPSLPRRVTFSVLVVVSLLLFFRGGVEHAALVSPARGLEREGAVEDLLRRVRALATPGGRFVVMGDARIAIVFSSRRGFDPGIPLLLIPEDVTQDGLAELLRHQFRLEAGQEKTAPMILLYPPENSSILPGLEPDGAPDPASGVLRLRLVPSAPR